MSMGLQRQCPRRWLPLESSPRPSPEVAPELPPEVEASSETSRERPRARARPLALSADASRLSREASDASAEGCGCGPPERSRCFQSASRDREGGDSRSAVGCGRASLARRSRGESFERSRDAGCSRRCGSRRSALRCGADSSESLRCGAGRASSAPRFRRASFSFTFTFARERSRPFPPRSADADVGVCGIVEGMRRSRGAGDFSRDSGALSRRTFSRRDGVASTCGAPRFCISFDSPDARRVDAGETAGEDARGASMRRSGVGGRRRTGSTARGARCGVTRSTRSGARSGRERLVRFASPGNGR